MLKIDLQDFEKYILKNLPKKVEEAKLNDYTTFGKNVEKPLSDVIEDYLKLKKVECTFKRAKKKNSFPDLEVIMKKETFAFEHKAAESSSVDNDLGTLNAFPKKIKKYGDNIYYFFVKYSKAKAGEGIVIDNIYIDKVYRFIGKMDVKDKLILKYRKKDGNLRPKTWSDFDNNIVYFNTLEEFKSAIKPTVEYRACELVIQHMKDLTDDDKLYVYKELGKEIDKIRKKRVKSK